MGFFNDLFGNPQQQAASDASAAVSQQGQIAQQLYQEALANQAAQQKALRGAVTDLGSMGNPFAAAASGMHPQFMSPTTNAGSFSAGKVPNVFNGAPPAPTPAAPPKGPAPASVGGGGGTRVPVPTEPRTPPNVFAGGRGYGGGRL